jgi:hypothetical protein
MGLVYVIDHATFESDLHVEKTTMTNAANGLAQHDKIGADFFMEIGRAYLWLAQWAERNVPAGEDGKHIPANVRQIIETRNFFV